MTVPMYHDALTNEDSQVKMNLLIKDIDLLNHNNQNTNEFSFDLLNKIREMKSELNKISS